MIQKDYEARLREMTKQNIDYANEIAKRDSRIQGLHIRIRELEAQLNHQSGVISALKQLYHSLDNKIMRTLTERGQHKKRRAAHHPSIAPHSANDYGSLLSLAKRYDVDEFFALKKRARTHDLKLGYRVVAKGYRVARDSTMAGAKKIYRLRAGQ